MLDNDGARLLINLLVLCLSLTSSALSAAAQQKAIDMRLESAQELIQMNEAVEPGPGVGKFDEERSRKLLAEEFDRAALSLKGLQYERLDQLTIDILPGVR